MKTACKIFFIVGVIILAFSLYCSIEATILLAANTEGAGSEAVGDALGRGIGATVLIVFSFIASGLTTLFMGLSIIKNGLVLRILAIVGVVLAWLGVFLFTIIP